MRADTNRDLGAVLKEAKPWLAGVSICGSDQPDQVRPAKDWVRIGVRPLDQGNYDLRQVLKVLKEIDYKDPIGFQCYGIQGDPRKILAASKAAWDAMR